MPSFTFDSNDLGHAFGVAKIVKPVTGDFTLKFHRDRLIIHSSDKRRYVRVDVIAKHTNDVSDDYESDEFYVSSDRQTLLGSDLSTITLSVHDKTISILAEGDGQSRNATLKKRSDSSRRPPIPKLHNFHGSNSVVASSFVELLHQVSCSAQVKETKSEEDMKVNQVHFYPLQNSAVSLSRYCGSSVFLSGLSLDLSIASNDVPIMKAFCSKLGDSDILVSQDQTHMYLGDIGTNSILCFSRVSSSKPAFSMLSDDGYKTILSVNRDQLFRSLQWANMAIEGTQRLSVHAFSSGDGHTMVFRSGHQEISRFPVNMILGSEMKSDFPVRVLLAIIGYIDSDGIVMKFCHEKSNISLQISGSDNSRPVQSKHFLTSMVSRELK